MIVFKSKIRNYCTSLRINGETKRIAFRDRSNTDSHGYYLCISDEVARALRKHPSFGSVITCEQEESADRPSPVKEYAATYSDVKRTQEANKVLTETYGVDKELLKSKADALQQAERLNIYFPNLH